MDRMYERTQGVALASRHPLAVPEPPKTRWAVVASDDPQTAVSLHGDREEARREIKLRNRPWRVRWRRKTLKSGAHFMVVPWDVETRRSPPRTSARR